MNRQAKNRNRSDSEASTTASKKHQSVLKHCAYKQRLNKCGYRRYIYLSHLMYNFTPFNVMISYRLMVAVSILASLAKEDIDRVK